MKLITRNKEKTNEAADAKTVEKPKPPTEGIGSKSEKASDSAKDDVAEIKPKESGITTESANTKSGEKPVAAARTPRRRRCIPPHPKDSRGRNV